MQTAIAGVSGRMGRTLLEAVAADADCVLHAAFDRPGSPLLGHDAGAAWGAASGVQVSDQPAAALARRAGLDRLHPSRGHLRLISTPALPPACRW
jgi:dihydrodipicolinate reductase